MGNIQM